MVRWEKTLPFLIAFTVIHCSASTNMDSEDKNPTYIGSFEQKELISSVSQKNLVGPATGLMSAKLSVDVATLGKEMIARIQESTGATVALDPPIGYQFEPEEGEFVEKFVFIGRGKGGSNWIHSSLHAIQSSNTTFSWAEWAFHDSTGSWTIEILIPDEKLGVRALSPAEFSALFNGKGNASELSQMSGGLSFDGCGAVSSACGTLLSMGYDALCKWGAVTLAVEAVGCVGAILTDSVGFVYDDVICVAFYASLELRPVLCSLPACAFASLGIALGCDVGVNCLFGAPFGCQCPWDFGTCYGGCEAIANFAVEHAVCEVPFDCAPGGLATPILKLCKKLGKGDSICDAVAGGLCSQIYVQSLGQGVDWACSKLCGIDLVQNAPTSDGQDSHPRSPSSPSGGASAANNDAPASAQGPAGFWCEAGGFTISAKFKCDGAIDCPGAEDEVECDGDHLCRPDEWACHDGTCIPQVCVCDGLVHCSVGAEDESNCGP